MLHAFMLKKKKGRDLSLDSTAESQGSSPCLEKSTFCARKSSILSPGRTGMLFLEDGIDMATELTQTLLKMPSTWPLREGTGSRASHHVQSFIWLCTYRKQA